MKRCIMNKELTHEVERGEIIRYLAEVGFSTVTFRALINHLDYSGYSVTDEGLEFHLGYLTQKGFIEIEEEQKEAGKKKRILFVQITPAGVDLHDHRKKGDTGVRF